MNSNKMFRVQHAVFILCCLWISKRSHMLSSRPDEDVTHLSLRVDDFGQERLILVLDLVTEGVFDRRIVGLDEVTLAVSDSER